jgi:hypothetical protein
MRKDALAGLPLRTGDLLGDVTGRDGANFQLSVAASELAGSDT